MSESDYIKAQIEASQAEKVQARRDARSYIQREHAVHGLDEADRDEILACLGISTEADIAGIHGSYGDRVLSRAGLTVNAARGPKPRTPPSRAV